MGNRSSYTSPDPAKSGLTSDGSVDLILSSTTSPAAGCTDDCNEPNAVYRNEMHRVLSFPDDLPLALRRELARRGFYSHGDKISCYFCRVSESLSSVDVSRRGEHATHECEQRDNVPLPADKSDFRFESNRLMSFMEVDWDKSENRPQARDLARWGFYFTGVGDTCRCTFCRLEVKTWEQSDTAEGEHRRWNPQCPFLNGRTVGNVKIGEEELHHKVVTDHAVAVAVQENVEQLATSKAIGSEESAPKHVLYASVASRMASFQTWPVALKLKVLKLCQAGLFYTGRGDQVKCFQCGGGLKDWTMQDDPWVEHAVCYPKCKFLIAMKGLQFINTVQEFKNHLTQQNQELADPEIVVHCKNNENTTNEYSGASAADARQCKVCKVRELGVVFLPCGHMTACSECADARTDCPLCHRHFTAKVAAHLG